MAATVVACTAHNARTSVETAIVAELRKVIAHEMRVHELPALSIALVDDQRILWSEGFGFADSERRVPATSTTIYRVGSISKLITDIAAMRLVERGRIGLDQDVRAVLPDFEIRERRGPAITLRHLMSHRSGILREPAIGSYFDASGAGLAATVASIRGSRAIYPVGSRTKYSNAGVSVVGRVLEVLSGESFATHVKRHVLDPSGMKHSSFERNARIERTLADASMWTHDGSSFEAPVFELGTSAAGNLYSSVDDLARFMSTLFRGGAPLVRPETLAKMYESQGGGRFGLGFALSKLGAQRVCGHGGAVYGFATQLSFLPDAKLGVVVATSVDCANAVAGRLAQHALGLLLARAEGREVPVRTSYTSDVPAKRAARMCGSWRTPGSTQPLRVSMGPRGLELFDGRGVYRIRALGTDDRYAIDDRHRYSAGLRFVAAAAGKTMGDKLVFGKRELRRVADDKPPAPPREWLELIGDYGPDHNILTVHERDGALYALVEWFEFDRLRPLERDLFAFPERGGMYHGETLRFVRGRDGKISGLRIGELALDRRGDADEDFTIEAQHPIEALRAKAKAGQPPQSSPEMRDAELVDLAKLDSDFRFDIRYASQRNFLRTRFYEAPRAFLQRPAAEALLRVKRALAARGYGLLIHDAYRPWSVTKMFWDATPHELKHFVANPERGSRHNRGCAVDLTLFERATGRVIEMPSRFDEFTPRAYAHYRGGTSLQRWHRELLRRAMEAEGFSVYKHEWWHFDYHEWRRYPILNLSFEEIEAQESR